jgi:hypothetical protein
MKIKRKWHLWSVSIFMIFIYFMGIYDFFMMLSHNNAYYESHGYGQAVIEYFTNYPLYFMIFWIINLLAGFISPILLILKDERSKNLALISAISDTILLILTFSFRNRWNVLGSSIAAFDFFILAITFALYFYCRYTFKKNRRV